MFRHPNDVRIPNPEVYISIGLGVRALAVLIKKLARRYLKVQEPEAHPKDLTSRMGGRGECVLRFKLCRRSARERQSLE